MAPSNKQLTSKDIFDLYKGWYEEKFDTEYTPHGFIGNELSAIKKVVDGEGLYKTLCGLYVGLRDSERQIKATYIMKGTLELPTQCSTPRSLLLSFDNRDPR
jgi:hypothetical protein